MSLVGVANEAVSGAADDKASVAQGGGAITTLAHTQRASNAHKHGVLLVSAAGVLWSTFVLGIRLIDEAGVRQILFHRPLAIAGNALSGPRRKPPPITGSQQRRRAQRAISL